jgi:hypothetical protein
MLSATLWEVWCCGSLGFHGQPHSGQSNTPFRKLPLVIHTVVTIQLVSIM